MRSSSSSSSRLVLLLALLLLVLISSSFVSADWTVDDCSGGYPAFDGSGAEQGTVSFDGVRDCDITIINVKVSQIIFTGTISNSKIVLENVECTNSSVADCILFAGALPECRGILLHNVKSVLPSADVSLSSSQSLVTFQEDFTMKISDDPIFYGIIITDIEFANKRCESDSNCAICAIFLDESAVTGVQLFNISNIVMRNISAVMSSTGNFRTGVLQISAPGAPNNSPEGLGVAVSSIFEFSNILLHQVDASAAGQGQVFIFLMDQFADFRDLQTIEFSRSALRDVSCKTSSSRCTINTISTRSINMMRPISESSILLITDITVENVDVDASDDVQVSAFRLADASQFIDEARFSEIRMNNIVAKSLQGDSTVRAVAMLETLIGSSLEAFVADNITITNSVVSGSEIAVLMSFAVLKPLATFKNYTMTNFNNNNNTVTSVRNDPGDISMHSIYFDIMLQGVSSQDPSPVIITNITDHDGILELNTVQNVDFDITNIQVAQVLCAGIITGCSFSMQNIRCVENPKSAIVSFCILFEQMIRSRNIIINDARFDDPTITTTSSSSSSVAALSTGDDGHKSVIHFNASVSMIPSTALYVLKLSNIDLSNVHCPSSSSTSSPSSCQIFAIYQAGTTHFEELLTLNISDVTMRNISSLNLECEIAVFKGYNAFIGATRWPTTFEFNNILIEDVHLLTTERSSSPTNGYKVYLLFSQVSTQELDYFNAKNLLMRNITAVHTTEWVDVHGIYMSSGISVTYCLITLENFTMSNLHVESEERLLITGVFRSSIADTTTKKVIARDVTLQNITATSKNKDVEIYAVGFRATGVDARSDLETDNLLLQNITINAQTEAKMRFFYLLFPGQYSLYNLRFRGIYILDVSIISHQSTVLLIGIDVEDTSQMEEAGQLYFDAYKRVDSVLERVRVIAEQEIRVRFLSHTNVFSRFSQVAGTDNKMSHLHLESKLGTISVFLWNVAGEDDDLVPQMSRPRRGTLVPGKHSIEDVVAIAHNNSITMSVWRAANRPEAAADIVSIRDMNFLNANLTAINGSILVSLLSFNKQYIDYNSINDNTHMRSFSLRDSKMESINVNATLDVVLRGVWAAPFKKYPTVEFKEIEIQDINVLHVGRNLEVTAVAVPFDVERSNLLADAEFLVYQCYIRRVRTNSHNNINYNNNNPSSTSASSLLLPVGGTISVQVLCVIGDVKLFTAIKVYFLQVFDSTFHSLSGRIYLHTVKFERFVQGPAPAASDASLTSAPSITAWRLIIRDIIASTGIADRSAINVPDISFCNIEFVLRVSDFSVIALHNRLELGDLNLFYSGPNPDQVAGRTIIYPSLSLENVIVRGGILSRESSQFYRSLEMSEFTIEDVEIKDLFGKLLQVTLEHGGGGNSGDDGLIGFEAVTFADMKVRNIRVLATRIQTSFFHVMHVNQNSYGEISAAVNSSSLFTNFSLKFQSLLIENIQLINTSSQRAFIDSPILISGVTLESPISKFHSIIFTDNKIRNIHLDFHGNGARVFGVYIDIEDSITGREPSSSTSSSSSAPSSPSFFSLSNCIIEDITLLHLFGDCEVSTLLLHSRDQAKIMGFDELNLTDNIISKIKFANVTSSVNVHHVEVRYLAGLEGSPSSSSLATFSFSRSVIKNILVLSSEIPGLKIFGITSLHLSLRQFGNVEFNDNLIEDIEFVHSTRLGSRTGTSSSGSIILHRFQKPFRNTHWKLLMPSSSSSSSAAIFENKNCIIQRIKFDRSSELMSSSSLCIIITDLKARGSSSSDISIQYFTTISFNELTIRDIDFDLAPNSPNNSNGLSILAVALSPIMMLTSTQFLPPTPAAAPSFLFDQCTLKNFNIAAYGTTFIKCLSMSSSTRLSHGPFDKFQISNILITNMSTLQSLNEKVELTAVTAIGSSDLLGISYTSINNNNQNSADLSNSRRSAVSASSSSSSSSVSRFIFTNCTIDNTINIHAKNRAWSQCFSTTSTLRNYDSIEFSSSSMHGVAVSGSPNGIIADLISLKSIISPSTSTSNMTVSDCQISNATTTSVVSSDDSDVSSSIMMLSGQVSGLNQVTVQQCSLENLTKSLPTSILDAVSALIESSVSFNLLENTVSGENANILSVALMNVMSSATANNTVIFLLENNTLFIDEDSNTSSLLLAIILDSSHNQNSNNAQHNSSSNSVSIRFVGNTIQTSSLSSNVTQQLFSEPHHIVSFVSPNQNSITVSNNSKTNASKPLLAFDCNTWNMPSFKRFYNWVLSSPSYTSQVDVAYVCKRTPTTSVSLEASKSSSLSLPSVSMSDSEPLTLTHKATLSHFTDNSTPTRSSSRSHQITHSETIPVTDAAFVSPFKAVVGGLTSASTIIGQLALTSSSPAVRAIRTRNVINAMDRISRGECDSASLSQPELEQLVLENEPDVSESPFMLVLSPEFGGSASGTVFGGLIWIVGVCLVIPMLGYAVFIRGYNIHFTASRRKKTVYGRFAFSTEVVIESKTLHLLFFSLLMLLEPMCSSAFALFFVDRVHIFVKALCATPAALLIASITMWCYRSLFLRNRPEEFFEIGSFVPVKYQDGQGLFFAEREEVRDEIEFYSELKSDFVEAKRADHKKNNNNVNAAAQDEEQKENENEDDDGKEETEEEEPKPYLVVRAINYLNQVKGEWKHLRVKANPSRRLKSVASFYYALPLIEGYTASAPRFAVADFIYVFLLFAVNFIGEWFLGSCTAIGVSIIVTSTVHLLLCLKMSPFADRISRYANPLLCLMEMTVLAMTMFGNQAGDMMMVAEMQLVLAIAQMIVSGIIALGVLLFLQEGLGNLKEIRRNFETLAKLKYECRKLKITDKHGNVVGEEGKNETDSKKSKHKNTPARGEDDSGENTNNSEEMKNMLSAPLISPSSLSPKITISRIVNKRRKVSKQKKDTSDDVDQQPPVIFTDAML